MTVFVYDAFMSYSQKADGAFAQALQGALEKIATPWYRRRSIRVFRDETTLKPARVKVPVASFMQPKAGY